jgi:methylated-DNA-[protein]-cysteine S-methyltransferase
MTKKLIKKELKKVTIKSSQFSSVVIIWSFFEENPKILRVILSKPQISAEVITEETYPEAKDGICDEIERTVEKIEAFLRGERVSFDLDIVTLEFLPPFQREVLIAQYGIPRGKVSTYKLIANHLGRAGAVRAVGRALARNPFPLIIPCHRTIRSDGSLGGYEGGAEMKKALLELEGVEIKGNRAVVEKFYYED